jgi:clan AA aspartic protease
MRNGLPDQSVDILVATFQRAQERVLLDGLGQPIGEGILVLFVVVHVAVEGDTSWFVQRLPSPLLTLNSSTCTVYASITLTNPRDEQLKPIEARALVDTGTMYLSIPEHVAIQLRLQSLHQREVTLANGAKQLCPNVGPICVRFQDRACFTGALILGDEVLMGAIPTEDMDW